MVLNKDRKPFYLLGSMFFFWALFDGLIAYIVPVLITSRGFSATEIGLIIGASNIFGMLFDFILVRYLRNTNYRRLFLIVYLLSVAYPIFLWFSKEVGMFLISMSIWGLYGDLNNFAAYDFLSRHSKSENHCKDAGVVEMTRGFGYLVAPMIAGILVVKSVDFFPISLSISFLIISLIFYILLMGTKKKEESEVFSHKAHKYNFWKEIFLMNKIGKLLMPVLLFNILMHVFDSIFWTIGPIYSQNFPNFEDFGGLFLTAYNLPFLSFLWLAPLISKKIGKKRTAYLSLITGCLIIIPISFYHQPVVVLTLIFLAAIAFSQAWPSIRGTFTDYIAESPSYEKEIETLNDFSSNIGYTIGPIVAGLMIDTIGYKNLFVTIAIIGITIALLLLIVTPRNIRVIIHRNEEN